MAMLLRLVRRARGGAPALQIAVILMLAAGVAALTVTFGIVRAALWREPPFPDAGRLAILFLERNPVDESPRGASDGRSRGAEELRRATTSFDAIATFSPASLTLSGATQSQDGGGETGAELVYGERVSGLATSRCSGPLRHARTAVDGGGRRRDAVRRQSSW